MSFLTGNTGILAIDRKTVAGWLEGFQQQIGTIAANDGLGPRDYACTILSAIVGYKFAVFYQIGDGSIVISTDEDDEYGWVFWPDKGEYENVTFFITDPLANEHLQFDAVPRHITELAIFTDGLQRLALHYASNMVHLPFFRTLFPAVRRADIGYVDALSGSLASFLESGRVNERTDDDKTLILATRVCPTEM